MNKFISSILIMMLTASVCNAATISADKIKQDITQVLLNDYMTKTSAEVDVKVTMLPFQSLSLPDGVISYEIVNTKDFVPVSREIKKVNILVDGKVERNLSVPVELKVYDEVLVASDCISREQPIYTNKVRLKKINIADKSNFVITKEMLGKELIAKKDYREGEVIDKRFIKLRPDVKQNSDVRIILNSNNGFQISIDGIAKMDGTIGEYVTVENRMYNKTYSAKVIGENTVQVNI